MKITEIVTLTPKGPMNSAQARIYALKNKVKTAQDTLKRERESQRRQKATERIRKAQASLNARKPA